MKQLEIEINLKIKNSHAWEFHIYDSNVNIELNGTYIGNVKIADQLKIPGKSENSYKVKVTSEFSLLKINLKTILPLIQSPSISVSGKGTILVGSKLFKKNIPVSFNENTSLKTN